MILLLALGAGCKRTTANEEAPPPTVRVHEVGDGSLAFVLLHGWGAHGDDLVPLARKLAADHRVRFVLPEAPRPHPRGGRAWFDPFAGQETKQQVNEARLHVERTIDALHARGYGDDRIIIGGFSQGAIMSVDVALKHPQLAGLVLLSGTTLPFWGGFESLDGTPVLITHGRADRILDFDKAVKLADRLKRAGARVTWVPFDGPHTIPPSAVTAIGRFLWDRVKHPAATTKDAASAQGARAADGGTSR